MVKVMPESAIKFGAYEVSLLVYVSSIKELTWDSLRNVHLLAWKVIMTRGNCHRSPSFSLEASAEWLPSMC